MKRVLSIIIALLFTFLSGCSSKSNNKSDEYVVPTVIDAERLNESENTDEDIQNTSVKEIKEIISCKESDLVEDFYIKSGNEYFRMVDTLPATDAQSINCGFYNKEKNTILLYSPNNTKKIIFTFGDYDVPTFTKSDTMYYFGDLSSDFFTVLKYEFTGYTIPITEHGVSKYSGRYNLYDSESNSIITIHSPNTLKITNSVGNIIDTQNIDNLDHNQKYNVYFESGKDEYTYTYKADCRCYRYIENVNINASSFADYESTGYTTLDLSQLTPGYYKFFDGGMFRIE